MSNELRRHHEAQKAGLIKARICQSIISNRDLDYILKVALDECGGDPVQAAGAILEVSSDRAVNPDLKPSDYVPAQRDAGLRSCNYCTRRDDCGADKGLMLSVPFVDRMGLMTSTKFWQAIAENCELYVLQKEGPS